MANVLYDSKAIIPAPLVTVDKVYRSTAGGSKYSTEYAISLTGTLLPFRGSPSGVFSSDNPSAAFWTLSGTPPDESYGTNDIAFTRIERKQEALRWLFSTDGKVLEWYGGALAPSKCRPRIVSISFIDGQWVDRCEYRIDLVADSMTGVVSDEDDFAASGLQEISDEWQFNELRGHDAKVYEISHLVSAKGIRTFDEVTGSATEAYKHAKQWCDARITGRPDGDFVTYATGFTAWVNGGYTKNTVIAEADGSYAITETWTIRQAGPGALAATYIEQSFTLTNNVEDNTIDLSYAGTIYGLYDGRHIGNASAVATAKAAVPDDDTARLAVIDAMGAFLGDYAVPVSPSQKNITVNEKDGVVTFSYDWNAGDSETYSQNNEATISYDNGSGNYTLVLNVDITGKGSTSDERLTNARANIPSDAAALLLAQSLVGSLKPAGITFGSSYTAKSSAVNETNGTVRVSWTWTDRDDNNAEVSVEISYPQIIAAKIIVPGRIAGPIIQRINTATAKQITVSYTSDGHDTRPDADTISDVMDEAGGVPYGPAISPWYPGSYILESDRETWNPTTGKYTRTRTHTVTES